MSYVQPLQKCRIIAAYFERPRSPEAHYFYARRSKANHQTGATIVEFLIVLPVFLLIISGIAEFGMALRNLEVISEAAKQGSRTGAVLSIQNLPAVPPSIPCIANSCDSEEGADCENSANSNTIECRAFRETQRYLQAVGEDPTKWTVRSAVCPAGNFSVLRLSVRRTPGTASCILCLHNLLSSDMEFAQSSYMLEGACN